MKFREEQAAFQNKIWERDKSLPARFARPGNK